MKGKEEPKVAQEIVEQKLDGPPAEGTAQIQKKPVPEIPGEAE